MLPFSASEFKKELHKYIWDFLHGDNIIHNYEICELLIKARNNLTPEKQHLFNKPILILLVGIIEGILIDFIIRLGEATNHFPSTISEELKMNIKGKINKERKRVTAEDPIFGRYTYARIKNYTLLEIKLFLEEFELLGRKDAVIYKNLNDLIILRNRIHSRNFFNNFERYERHVFRKERLNETILMLTKIDFLLKNRYPRPWQ